MALHALILHGIYGHPGENWFPWIAEQLEAKGIPTAVPHLPTHEPLLPEHWWKALSDAAVSVDAETIVIGHSLGVAFALKIIEEQPVKAAFFVAPAWGKTGNEFDPVMNAVADQDFDWERIRKNCPHFTIFQSDNDPYVKMERAESLAKHLGTKVTEVPGAGHFNTASGYTKFGLLLREIERCL